MATTQKHRIVSVKSPLGEDVLLFRQMTAREELGRLSEFHLDLLSENETIKMEDVLGKKITVKMALREGGERFFNGYVSRFAQIERVQGLAHYEATLKPWLWFLTRTADCRIFQDKTIPEIIKEIFRDHGFSDFKESLNRSYKPKVYCVQYRETDFNFVSRLMEQEGMYYFFEHEDDKHTLVMADSYSAHRAIDPESIPYLHADELAVRERDHISEWFVSQEIQPGAFALNDFDFEKPRASASGSLKVKSLQKREHALADYEIYDYPGEYTESGDGESYAKTWLEALQTQHEQTRGSGDARGLAVGGLFKLTEYPREDQNREYLITSANYSFGVESYESGGGSGINFNCNFQTIPSKQPYRAARITPKPMVQGPQTAIVVGKAGEEIWTDKYGRIKVQFHWDRYGKADENSSCWVRVSHPWAGKNWGAIAIPRMGQEVIIDFLEGDPDQPIITGRVYNADQMPPWDLPANATQSGVLSRSSKGGSAANANAIRMEDKKGAEQLWIHAEKNQDIEVENDETHWVGHDRKKTIDNDETTLVKHDRTETVGNNEKITIGVDRTEKVGSNETIGVGLHRSVTVGATETKKVALQRTHLVGANETIGVIGAQEIGIGVFQAIVVGTYQTTKVGGYQNNTIGVSQTNKIGTAQTNTIGAAQSTTVGAAQLTKVTADRSINVGGAQSVAITGKASMTVGADESRAVTGGRSSSIGKDDSLKITNNLVIDAGDSVTIKTGSASISMKKDGTITIKGKDITIDGSGKINIKADGDIVMKGSKILQN